MTSNQDEKRPSLSERVAKTTRDVRSLGIGAPLRGAYEASKRIGGHSVVFGRLVPSSSEATPQSNPFEPPIDVPMVARDRTLAAADRIVEGNIELFSQDLMFDDPPTWHSLIHTAGSWPDTEWWKIDLRSDERPGDVKWAWELGRQRHLVILARAVYLDPSKKAHADTLNRQLSSWLTTNPPEIGVHWYSNLEISLRALASLQILALAGDSLDESVRNGMWSHLHHSGRHLMTDLPYTVSTMRNNHLLGDALGLITLGKAFGGRSGDRWVRVGNRLFDRQLERHMRSDGSMIEDSVSYHRFVLEMLAMRVVIGDAPDSVSDALEVSSQFLARLGVLDGPVPQYGDWDEGRVVAVAGDAADLAGSVYLALALSGDGAPAEWREHYDEVAWFSAEDEPVAPDEAEVAGSDVGGDIARAEVGDYTAWLKGGHCPSHGHADVSSVSIAWQGNWIVGDPGTGTYNGDIELRNRLRSSESHSVARVDGVDQLEPHRVFRWQHDATGRIGEPIEIDGTVVMWSVHNAYGRLDPARRVVRLVAVGDSGVEVVDIVEGPPTGIETSLPLGPDCQWDADSSQILIGEERRWSLQTASVVEEQAGEWSETYGAVTSSIRLSFAVSVGTRSSWQVGDGSPVLGDVDVTFTDDTVTIKLGRGPQQVARLVTLPG